jgi:hypothetical protein
MNVTDHVNHVQSNFARIYLGGIPCVLNDDGAFLSFICCLTATEALAGFLNPALGNGPRFKEFVRRYFPPPYPLQADTFWRFRNAAVHGFSPGPYKLVHHKGNLHLTTDGGQTVLNAEDFYATVVLATRQYFDDLRRDANLQAVFLQRANDPDTGLLAVVPATGVP